MAKKTRTADDTARAGERRAPARQAGTRRSTAPRPASAALSTQAPLTGVFSCSKATNELNFATQKFARVALGTNNVDSCNRT